MTRWAALAVLLLMAGCTQTYEADESLLKVNRLVGLTVVGEPLPPDQGRFSVPPVEGRVTSVAVLREIPADTAAGLDMETDWGVTAADGQELVVLGLVCERSDRYPEAMSVETAGASAPVDLRVGPPGDPRIVVVASVRVDDPVWLVVRGVHGTTRYDLRHLSPG